MNYFIKVGGEEKGPFSAEQIRRMVEDGLTEADLARREDGHAWVPLGSLYDFRQAPPQSRRRTSSWAVVSLAFIVVPIVLLFTSPATWLLPVVLVGWLVALLCEQAAIGQIRSHAHFKGLGMAIPALGIYYAILCLLALSAISPSGPRIMEKGEITQGIHNCRQIITMLRLSADNGGKYPDAALPEARSSNSVFRQMFVWGDADNEMIFGCPLSTDGTPDGNIGKAPDFREAVRANENHWAMTKGLTDASDGKIPLVFENPQDATWPPKWNPDAVGTGKPGRTWKGGKVIVGFNDSSVVLMPLESASGEHVGLKPDADGKPVFPDLHPKPEVLPAEVKE